MSAHPQNERPTVLIYRDQLLPYSETFILEQSRHLQRYCPYFACTTTLGALDTDLPPDQVFSLEATAPWPGVEKMAYKLVGRVPTTWYRQLQGTAPQLIHAHFGFDGLFALALANRLHRPLLVTCHGYDATLQADPDQLKRGLSHGWDFIRHRGRFFRERYLKQRSRLFQSAHHILAVSDFIRRALIEQGCPAPRVTTHYIGIDVQRFTPPPQRATAPMVLFVGRLVAKKGVGDLLQAMADVQQVIPDVRLVVIGDGPLRSALQKLAQDLGVRVDFLGKQPPTAVQDWMNRATVFCGPSLVTPEGDAEGLGMVFLEAQAMALPVVSYASGGIPEAVAHGETGLLVPERDRVALAQGLVTFLQRPDLCQKFGQAGRQRVITQFDIRTQTAQLEGMYDQILAASNALHRLKS